MHAATDCPERYRGEDKLKHNAARFSNRGILHLLWGGQSWLQAGFQPVSSRRLRGPIPRRGRLKGGLQAGLPAPQSIALAAAILLTAGCGYIGAPMTPLANVPNRISDLATMQRGPAVIVHCTLPTLTTENVAIRKSVKLDLRIGAAGEHFDPAAWAREATPVSPVEIKDGIATYKIATREWTGKQVTIGVRSIGANGKPSAWSNFETFPVVAPPETPSRPDVTDTAAGEHLAWTGRGDQFRVLRRVGDEKEYTVAATVTGHEWTDAGIDYGKPYSYLVQALVDAGNKDAGNKKVAESDLSEANTLTPVDTFPPAVPSGLRADRTANSVSLVWESDTEPDLAGYRVYRSEGSGPWQKLADVNAVPSYSDTAVEHGKTYHYAVSAFDKAAKVNESERSAPVEVVFP